MIQVKGTKAAAPQLPSGAQYSLKEPDKESKAPMFAVLFLTGVALYLQSAFPSWSKVAAQPQASPEPKADAEQEDQANGLGPAETVQAVSGGDEDRLEGEAAPRAEAASTSKPIVFHSGASYELAGYPEIDIVKLAGESLSTKRLRPTDIRPKPVNDNMTGSGISDGSDGGASPSFGAAPAAGLDEAGLDDDDRASNRTPRSTGAVQLKEAFGSTAILIGLPDLLRNTSDADGDKLSVENLKVSSGTIVETAEGWLFTPSSAGPVIVSYQINDGKVVVNQFAQLSVEGFPLKGTDDADPLKGSEFADDIDAGKGDDIVEGHGGKDIINGGDGNDRITGGHWRRCCPWRSGQRRHQWRGRQ